MTFKSIAEFLDPRNGHRPTSAERKLIKATQAGEACILNDPDKPARPTAPSDATTIRAPLLRLLILGGTEDCGLHESGVWLEGGWIEGKLDLTSCTGTGRIVLKHCRFNVAPDFASSVLKHLDLGSSAFPGFSALGMSVTGDVLVTGAESSATIDLRFVCIDSRLSFAGSTLQGSRAPGTRDDDPPITPALKAEGLKLGSDLILRKTTCLGLVDLTHATINGQLDCTEASFDYGGKPEDIIPYVLADDNDRFVSHALSARRLHVERGFLFSKVRKFNGHLMLHGAHIGDLLDDIESWPKGPSWHLLAGFTYNRFGVSAPANIANRLKWLMRGVESYPAYAQPYTQLASVLRQAGHSSEAREVLIERDLHLAEHRLASDREDLRAAYDGGVMTRGDCGQIWLRMNRARLWSVLTYWVAGYGYAPRRALVCALAVVGISFFAYMLFWQLGAMVPTDSVILTSFDWWWAMQEDPSAPALKWTKYGTGAHYETFYSLPYALDVFLPIVDLGQQSTWGQTTVTWAGWWARLWTWGLQIAGYVITSLGLAAATGIIQRNQPD